MRREIIPELQSQTWQPEDFVDTRPHLRVPIQVPLSTMVPTRLVDLDQHSSQDGPSRTVWLNRRCDSVPACICSCSGAGSCWWRGGRWGSALRPSLLPSKTQRGPQSPGTDPLTKHIPSPSFPLHSRGAYALNHLLRGNYHSLRPLRPSTAPLTRAPLDAVAAACLTMPSYSQIFPTLSPPVSHRRRTQPPLSSQPLCIMQGLRTTAQYETHQDKNESGNVMFDRLPFPAGSLPGSDGPSLPITFVTSDLPLSSLLHIFTDLELNLDSLAQLAPWEAGGARCPAGLARNPGRDRCRWIF